MNISSITVLVFVCGPFTYAHKNFEEQRREVIQCHFSIKLCGLSRSKPAFSIQAMEQGIGMLAKTGYVIITAEMLPELYTKVLSVLQTKIRGSQFPPQHITSFQLQN